MKSLQHLALALAAFSVLGSAAAAQPQGDRHFLEDAMKGDNSEMMLGQIASERGASSALRDYGRILHEDHVTARRQVVPLARRAGVSISDQPVPEAAQERIKLGKLRGHAFDREFASYMVKDHRKDVAEFEKQARKRGPAAELAKQTLPVLRKHLAMAERLARS